MGKDKKQTTTQRLDPASQGFVDQQRRQATSAADVALNQPGSFFAGPADISTILANTQQFLNPYTEQVIGGVNQQYDQLRAGATRASNQAAAHAGSFGGSRHGVMEGQAYGELGRAQAQQVGGLLSEQFNEALLRGNEFTEYQRALRERKLQEPLFRNQAAQGFYNAGLGPVGGTTEQVTPGNLVGDIFGAGLTIAGGMMGGPGGAAAASKFAGGGGGGGGFTPPSFFQPPNYNQFSRFGR